MSTFSFVTEEMKERWAPVLDVQGLPEISDEYRRLVTCRLLENVAQDSASQQQFGSGMFLSEAPTNATGTGIANYDPILIAMTRRLAPLLMAYDVCGVQPLSGPNGLIFAMRSRYVNQSGTEALFNEANTAFSAHNALGANGTAVAGHSGADFSANATWTTSNGMSTAKAEGLGDSGSNQFAEMALSIEKISVEAVSRALKAEYSLELAQDLRAIHGMDIETELANILSTEILAEINREVIRTIYTAAKIGCQQNTATAGAFDLDVDANGRWSVEKFKGLYFQIEREANMIARLTRRGKGNVMITSSDVASALNLAGVLDYNPAMQQNLNVDDSQSTFAGTIGGRMKVFIDPYFSAGVSGNPTDQFAVIGYKGSNFADAGVFYAPYVPLQMLKAQDPNTFQPKIGFKTRYGLKANPFATATGNGELTQNTNLYYRRFSIKNIM